MEYETDRLSIRRQTRDDLDFVASMLANAEVMRFWPRTLTRDEAAAWIERQLARYAADGAGYALVLDRASATPIGQAGVIRNEVDGVSEWTLGYMLHRPYWGHGYATEAAAGAMASARATCGDVRIVALIRPENTPSRRVAERLGLSIERTTMFKGFDHLVYV